MNLGEYKNRLCALFFPVRSYNESFVQSGLFQLSNRRQELVDILFKEVLQNEPDKLHGLLLALTVKKKAHGNLGPFSRPIDFVTHYFQFSQVLNSVCIVLQFAIAFY